MLSKYFFSNLIIKESIHRLPNSNIFTLPNDNTTLINSCSLYLQYHLRKSELGLACPPQQTAFPLSNVCLMYNLQSQILVPVYLKVEGSSMLQGESRERWENLIWAAVAPRSENVAVNYFYMYLTYHTFFHTTQVI